MIVLSEILILKLMATPQATVVLSTLIEDKYTIPQLSRKLKLARSTISRAVKLLVDYNLITRVRYTDDYRVAIYTATISILNIHITGSGMDVSLLPRSK